MDAATAIALKRGIISFVASHSDKFIAYSCWLLGIGIVLAISFVAYLFHREKRAKNS